MLGDHRGNRLRVGRFLPSGAVDTSFGRHGLVKLNTHHNLIYDPIFAGDTVGVQSMGNIVLLYADHATGANAVLRLLPDGSIDSGFGSGGSVVIGGGSGPGHNRDPGFAVASDDRIVASAGAAIVRLLPDGAFDPSFGTAGSAATNASLPPFATAQLVVRPDASVVAIGGDLCLPPYSSCTFATRFVRLLGDGKLAPAFAAGGELAYVSPNHPFVDAFSLAVEGGGAIYFTGNTTVGPLQAAVVTGRLLPGGVLDASFGTGGEVTTAVGDPLDYTFAIALQPDAKIVAGGYSQHVRRGTDQIQSLLIRYLP